MKKVLVTGGAGFIGSHTVDLLLEKNIPVRVLDNFSSGHRSNLDESNPLLEIVTGDIVDTPTVREQLSGISHCLHLAAQVSVVASLEDPVHSATQNILGFVNVLSECHNQGIEKLVYASSAAVYGNPSQIPLPEDAEKSQLSPYGLEKQINEEYADLFSRLYGLSTLGQRFFNVYGPRQDPASPYAGVIALFVDAITQNREITIFGDGKQTRDFIYVKDVARANVAALQGDVTGACNIGTGIESTLLDLIEVLSMITSGNSTVNHEAARDGDIRHSLASVARMNRELGVDAQTDIEEGLRALINHSQNCS
ncbi:NAD-dependent epimerase/dehydratase family protein [Pseudomonadota bacterium]